MVRFSGARRALAIGMFAALVAVPGIASAADPKAGPDQLTLQDGTIVTGTFTEFVPQNRVTVLVNGESKTYQWNLLRKATHDGKVVAENQPAALPPPVVVVQPQPQQQVVVVQGQPPGAQPAPQGALTESVLVHMEADEEAVLELQDRNDKASYQPVCHAPCNKMLPLDAMYRITGEGIRDSRAFKLAGTAGQAVQLNVNPGHKGGFAGGLVMTIIGPVALLSGAVVYLAGSASFRISTSGFSSNSNETLQVTGGVMMLAGAALTAVGIPLLVSNARTKVTQEVGTPVHRDRDAMLRLPTFRDTAHEVPMPPVSVVPVFARSF